MALASDKDLLIGTVESIQRLHITPVPLPGIANNITHMPEAGLVAVGIDEQELEELARASASGPSLGAVRSRAGDGVSAGDGELTQTHLLYHRVRVFDDQTMEPIDVVDLDPGETVTAIMTATLQDGKVLTPDGGSTAPASADAGAGTASGSGSGSSA